MVLLREVQDLLQDIGLHIDVDRHGICICDDLIALLLQNRRDL